MTKTLIRTEADKPIVPSAVRNRVPNHPSSDVEALDKATIAELTPDDICRMTRSELVRVIRSAGMPLPREKDFEQLELHDRETLQRLVYLTRRCCRNQGY